MFLSFSSIFQSIVNIDAIDDHAKDGKKELSIMMHCVL